MEPGPPAPSLAADAALSARLMELADRLDRAGLPEPARNLTRAASTQGRRTLRAIVLGRFSVGKSTLINAFLGYPVLPGGLAPTTGVICRISFGPPGAAVRFTDGTVEQFAGPEALEPYVALSQAGAAPARPLDSIVRVEVSLPLPLLRNQLEIVDSPGLDEAADRTRESMSGVDSADVVLFVLAADQLLGEVEREFLLREVISRSPGALALVVNFWDRIAAADRPGVMERLSVGAAELAERWRQVSGSETDVSVPLFPLSAARALRSRWKGLPAPESGIEALEQWLMDQASKGASVLQRSLDGRVRFAARDARGVVEAEQNNLHGGLRDAERAAAEALAIRSRAERSISRAAEIARAAAPALRDSLGVRMAAGQDRFSRAITGRLQEDPFSSLDLIRREISEWWRKTVAGVEAESASYLVEIAGLLQDAGCSVPPGALPPLDLGSCILDFEFSAVSDSAAPVKDTISGLLGSVSRGAADSAADWMNRASRAALSRTARTRAAAQDAVEKLEGAASLAGVRARAVTAEWGTHLAAAVKDAADPHAASLREESHKRDRLARAARERLAVLTALSSDLAALAD